MVGVAQATTGVIVSGLKYDADGTGDYFETDQPIASTTPTLLITLAPASCRYFLLEEINYRLEAAENVTYELYLLEGASAAALIRYYQTVYDSGASKARSTNYTELPGGASAKVPRIIKLDTAATLYYMIDWSGTPGNTPGYIYIKGQLLKG